MYGLATVLYNMFLLPALSIGLRLGSLFSPKIRRGLKVRRSLFNKLADCIPDPSDTILRFWIHISSMGEFEQARPVVSALRKQYPRSVIIMSVFSPSVYDHIQQYDVADCFCYLPFDSSANARRFIDCVHPDVAVFVRHDLWPNHLRVLKQRGIPTILINCSFKDRMMRSGPIHHMIYRWLYQWFDLVLTVSSEAKHVCETANLTSGIVEVAGDTRYDQVMLRASEAEAIAAPLRPLKQGRLGFVAGSTWPGDEDVILDAISTLREKDLTFWTLIVPHEPTDEHILLLEEKCARIGLKVQRLSVIELGHPAADDALLIADKMGILAELYTLGDVTYVGGGFGTGIHSVLEPAALGRGVLFGPNHQGSHEAGRLILCGGGRSVANSSDLAHILLALFRDPHQLAIMGDAAGGLVKDSIGATGRIVKRLTDLVRSKP